MDYLIVFLMFGFLIFIHELGHFIAAKLSGIPIERFSIGIGPKLWSFRKGQTEYYLSAFPVGGYVLPGIKDENEFYQIPPSRRIIFALGGPLANIIFAALCLGFLNAITTEFSFYAVLILPFVQTADMASQILSSLPALFSKPGQLSGIVGVVAMGGQLVAGSFLKVLQLCIMLNINLAILNLLPLPPLDGGKIVFCLLEKVHRSLVKLHMPVTIAGWILLMGLISYVTVIDVCKYVFKVYA